MRSAGVASTWPPAGKLPPAGRGVVDQSQKIIAVMLIAAGASAFTNVSLVCFTYFDVNQLRLDMRDAQLGLVVDNLVAIAVLLLSALSDSFGCLQVAKIRLQISSEWPCGQISVERKTKSLGKCARPTAAGSRRYPRSPRLSRAS